MQFIDDMDDQCKIIYEHLPQVRYNLRRSLPINMVAYKDKWLCIIVLVLKLLGLSYKHKCHIPIKNNLNLSW